MHATAEKRIYIHEVSPRDGFQIEPVFVPTHKKIDYIDRLSRTGLAKIEVTSFVAPGVVPGLADAEEVLRKISRVRSVAYTALVPNVRGCQRALATELDEINLVMSASESHNRENLRMSSEESLAQFAAIVRCVDGRIAVSASVSTAFGCPFEGLVEPARVVEILARINNMGIRSVALCDTTGVANPRQVADLFDMCLSKYPDVKFTAHFHNTRGMGLANALAALEAGVDRFDASLGGLGGCPFAPGATGNVCTEDLVHMLANMGCDTGVDLTALLLISQDLPMLVGHDIPGQVVKAGPSSRRYPLTKNSTLDPITAIPN